MSAEVFSLTSSSGSGQYAMVGDVKFSRHQLADTVFLRDENRPTCTYDFLCVFLKIVVHRCPSFKNVSVTSHLCKRLPFIPRIVGQLSSLKSLSQLSKLYDGFPPNLQVVGHFPSLKLWATSNIQNCRSITDLGNDLSSNFQLGVSANSSSHRTD